MSLKQIQLSASVLLALLALSGFAPEGAMAATSIASPVASADDSHPLVMQQAGGEVATAKVGTLQPFTSNSGAMGPTRPLGGAIVSGPMREVFGFALASSLADPTLGYPSWNFSLLSTVAFFGLHVNDNGTLAADSGMSVWNSSQLMGLLSAAHAHGTKVVVTIILQDFSGGTPHMCSGLRNASTTIANVVAQLAAKGVDGVNLDYEGLNGSCGTSDSSWARHAFTALAANLRAHMPGGSYLSVDTYASSAADSLGFFDVPGLAPYVDSYFVMAYDLEYSNYTRAPAGCSSFCLGPTAPLTGYYYNDTSTAAQYAAVVPTSKVILGVPYYGRKACVSLAYPNEYPTSSIVADAYTDAVAESSSNLVKPGTFTAHRDPHDPSGLERWDTWVNTQLNCIRELYWDDVVSLGQKYALVNRDNLRGVGIWNLNYGGGAGELWATLSNYFSCPVSLNVQSPETTTKISISVGAQGCAVGSFEIQASDTTLNTGWYGVGPITQSGTTATAGTNGYQGHTYQFRARVDSANGAVSNWAMVTSQVLPGATRSEPWAGLYVMTAYGVVAPDASPPLIPSATWNWKIARTAHFLPGANAPQAGAVLDGWGGFHPYGAPMTIQSAAYWPGWDIARDFAFLPNGTGGYVLDGYGGLHGFSVNGGPVPPAPQGAPYWHGWDIARKVVIFSDGTGGYVLDGYGAVHTFGIGRPALANPNFSAHWNWDIARDMVLIPGTESGYVLDGWGGIHPFAPVGQALPPAFVNSPYWPRWDIARSIWLLPSSTLAAPKGYVMDGYAGVHPIGGAPDIANQPYWWNQDIARNLWGA